MTLQITEEQLLGGCEKLLIMTKSATTREELERVASYRNLVFKQARRQKNWALAEWATNVFQWKDTELFKKWLKEWGES